MVKKFYADLIRETLRDYADKKVQRGDSLDTIIYRAKDKPYSWQEILDEVEKGTRIGRNQVQIIYNYACYLTKVERYTDFSTTPNGKTIDDFPKEKKDLISLISENQASWEAWREGRNQTKQDYRNLLKNPKNKALLKKMFELSINYLYNIIGDQWHPRIHQPQPKQSMGGPLCQRQKTEYSKG